MVGQGRERGKASTLALAIGFRSGDEFGQLSLLECGRIEVMEWRDDRHANRLGIYRATRPPLDAADDRWRAPRWIRYWMIAATRMGDGWLWYALGAMLMVYGGPQKFAALARPDPRQFLGFSYSSC